MRKEDFPTKQSVGLYPSEISEAVKQGLINDFDSKLVDHFLVRVLHLQGNWSALQSTLGSKEAMDAHRFGSRE